jgi:hypothetical protein
MDRSRGCGKIPWRWSSRLEAERKPREIQDRLKVDCERHHWLLENPAAHGEAAPAGDGRAGFASRPGIEYNSKKFGAIPPRFLG